MQTDMHYYATYAMARAAGLNDGTARVIATAAEYVDDSDHIEVTLRDGTRVVSQATAHHPADRANTDRHDQWRTWVPFHFLPGNTGTTQDEKLLCTIDSALAREMVEHHISHARQDHAVLLVGIAAHVYSDTFSHYGFSGISSDYNRVDTGSVQLHSEDRGLIALLRNKADNFVNRYVGEVVDLFKLGHASVATYPDRPYLTWSFTYRDGMRHSGRRENPVTFARACEQLHRMFALFNGAVPGFFGDASKGHTFAQIRQAVCDILVVEADMDERIAAWQEAAVAGRLYPNPGREPIPVYDASSFEEDLEALAELTEAQAKRTLIYQFITAAEVHRNYVLDDLLPRHGIEIS